MPEGAESGRLTPILAVADGAVCAARSARPGGSGGGLAAAAFLAPGGEPVGDAGRGADRSVLDAVDDEELLGGGVPGCGNRKQGGW